MKNRVERVTLHTLFKSRVGQLAEESANCGLGVRRQGVEQLVGVQTGGLHEFPGGINDALGHVALQGLGLEGLCDVSEALSSLGENGRVRSMRVLVFRKLQSVKEMERTYCSISSARKE